VFSVYTMLSKTLFSGMMTKNFDLNFKGIAWLRRVVLALFCNKPFHQLAITVPHYLQYAASQRRQRNLKWPKSFPISLQSEVTSCNLFEFITKPQVAPSFKHPTWPFLRSWPVTYRIACLGEMWTLAGVRYISPGSQMHGFFLAAFSWIWTYSSFPLNKSSSVSL